MHNRLLIAACLFIPFSSLAATTTWQAFDYKNCKHWYITTDYDGNVEAFQKASETIKKLEQSGNSSVVWQVLHGSTLFEDGGERYGICSISAGTITCQPSPEFPLGGTTFSEQGTKTFKCTKGCEKLEFHMLYEMGYEDGPDSKYFGAAARKFEAVCHESQKMKEFSEKQDKRNSK